MRVDSRKVALRNLSWHVCRPSFTTLAVILLKSAHFVRSGVHFLPLVHKPFQELCKSDVDK